VYAVDTIGALDPSTYPAAEYGPGTMRDTSEKMLAAASVLGSLFIAIRYREPWALAVGGAGVAIALVLVTPPPDLNLER
jgi:hypothetical protein